MLSPFALPESSEVRTLPGLKKQRTLGAAVSTEGVGLFTGEKVSICLKPSLDESGIVFQRTDLPHRPILPAKLEYVQGTPRCTIIGDNGVVVQTVEHILAALKGCEIDHVLIEISGAEVPIFDGSSTRFIEMIQEAGIVELQGRRTIYSIETPMFWSQGEIQLIALPSHEYRISYVLDYPHSTAIGTQFYSIAVNQESFEKEIASCRTFSIYEEIAPLIEKGFIKGGSLDNAIIVKENQVINPGGLRFSDEMVRHKILDLIGDLSLVPVPFLAHIIAICSGHTSNNAFAKELFKHIKMENS